jgi:DNA polymerase III epsilon subunit-like protein
MKTIFVDLETDGVGTFRPPRQRIIQVAAIVKHEDDSQTEHEWYSNSVEKVSDSHPSPYLLDICKKQGQPTEDIIREFCALIDSDTLFVAHNVDFDMGVLIHECTIRKSTLGDCLMKLKKMDVRCTMKRSINLCKLPPFRCGSYKFPKLSELAAHLGIEMSDEKAHNAIYDIEITKKCYDELVEMD